jgi:23S rRNA (adenine2503-C2)-methyltransferase
MIEYKVSMERPANLLTFTQDELVEFFARSEEPAYRARQVFAGLQQRRLQSFAAMTDLPKALRAHLDSIATASTLSI